MPCQNACSVSDIKVKREKILHKGNVQETREFQKFHISDEIWSKLIKIYSRQFMKIAISFLKENYIKSLLRLGKRRKIEEFFIRSQKCFFSLSSLLCMRSTCKPVHVLIYSQRIWIRKGYNKLKDSVNSQSDPRKILTKLVQY